MWAQGVPGAGGGESSLCLTVRLRGGALAPASLSMPGWLFSSHSKLLLSVKSLEAPRERCCEGRVLYLGGMPWAGALASS